LESALKGFHALALAIFGEEFGSRFKVRRGGGLLALLQHLAEGGHGGLETRFLKLGFLAFNGGLEALNEGLHLKVIELYPKATELLAESASCAVTECVGGIFLGFRRVHWRWGNRCGRCFWSRCSLFGRVLCGCNSRRGKRDEAHPRGIMIQIVSHVLRCVRAT
jgi:hypothetical protein